MKKIIPLILLVAIAEFLCQCHSPVDNKQKTDWLIDNSQYVANIDVSGDGKDIVLCNGLVERIFRIEPNVACTGYKNLVSGQQLLRAVKPEAELVIDGKKYNVGGLYGQKELAYLLPEWIDSFTFDENDFQYVSYSESEIKSYINWKQTFWAGKNNQPSGKTLTFLFHSKTLKGIEVAVHYELYDGLPLIVKWLSIKNTSDKPVEIGKVVNEKLALVEEESAV
ncbi:MAG: alpha-galactosidase, partial [Bacteroidia bacterium]|nr:alpha-galactosidase [Bacteroidia bacterium]